MKKAALLAFVMVFSIFIVSCSQSESIEQEEQLEVEVETDKPEELSQEEKEVAEVDVVEEVADLVEGEKVETPIESDLKKLEEMFKLSVDEIYTQYGEPNDRGFYGGEYISYDHMIYFIYEGSVSALMPPEGYEIFGLAISTTYEEIKAQLGDPVSEGISEMDNTYMLTYELGDYTFFFESETQDGKYYLELKKTVDV